MSRSNVRSYEGDTSATTPENDVSMLFFLQMIVEIYDMIHLLKALFLGKLLHDRHRHRKHETWYLGSNVTNIMTLLEISYFVMFYSKRRSLTCRIHTPNGTNVLYGPICRYEYTL